MKEAICWSTKKEFPTPRPMKLIFIPPISIFFPSAMVDVIVHRMCYMRTGCLQLQSRFWRYSVFTSENRQWSSFHIQGTESIPANHCCKAERFLHRGSPHSGVSRALEHQQEKEDFSGNHAAPAPWSAWLSPVRNAGLWPFLTWYSN